MVDRSAGRVVLSNNENIQIDKNYLYDWSKKEGEKKRTKSCFEKFWN